MERLANKIASHERKLQALELRKAGVSYQVIAEQLGYSGASGAFAAVKAALRDTLREPAQELRELELSRLDAALLAVWRRVQAGDEKAIDRMLAIMKRRSELLGLDRKPRPEPQEDDHLIVGRRNLGAAQIAAAMDRDPATLPGGAHRCRAGPPGTRHPQRPAQGRRDCRTFREA